MAQVDDQIYVKAVSFLVSDELIKLAPNLIPVDMNKGSRGKYIYPIVYYTSNREEAITGFAFVQDNQAVPMHYQKINQDLNEGADGKYNYLCFAKIGNIKITEVTFVALDNALNTNVYNGYNVFEQDLNTGASKVGAYVYLLYKTE